MNRKKLSDFDQLNKKQFKYIKNTLVFGIFALFCYIIIIRVTRENYEQKLLKGKTKETFTVLSDISDGGIRYL